MNEAQKLRIISRYLEKKSPGPAIAIDGAAEHSYQALGEGLDWLETHATDLFDMRVIEEDPNKMRILFNIFDYSVSIEKGPPPILGAVNLDALRHRTQFWQRDMEITALPGCDFYNRQTTKMVDDGLVELIVACRDKLRPVIGAFLPRLDIANQEALQTAIVAMKKTMQEAAAGSAEQALAKQQLSVLEDLNKVNQLSILMIPQEGQAPLTYCTLAEAVGGVTKKVTLISAATVFDQLRHLIESDTTTLEQYSEHRNEYKLSTDAILKLPKHGKVTEVQREAMALNISRMLGLTTSRSTMLTHDGAPALFLPFDPILLLQDVSSGKTMKARLFGSGKYTHYSTLNPIGEGLQSEQIIEDFGHCLGFIYLCSDTDAIGGYCQNKALRGNELFIFDQVLTDKDKLGLDSRLSMQPISFLTKHTRHDQGRNRTLIEDSSMDRKFASLMQLKQEMQRLLQYCARVAFDHDTKITQLERSLLTVTSLKTRHEINEQIRVAKLYLADVNLLKDKIYKRIKDIDKIMPSHPPEMDIELVKKTLVLEKLLNIPRLFADDGRPYRNPWTYRNTNHAVEVLPVAGGPPSQFKIKFNQTIPDAVLAIIRRQLGEISPIKCSKNEIIIHETALRALQETTLFPEHQSHFVRDQNYLLMTDLEVIRQGYGAGLHVPIMEAIRGYHAIMTSDRLVDDKLRQLQSTEMVIKSQIAAASDEGFGKHVLKKFQFDVQQKLQAMMPEDYNKAQLAQAFSCAYKLDRVSQFNAVVLEAVRQDKLSDQAFLGFLEACIDRANRITHHFDGVTLSTELDVLAKNTVDRLQHEIVPLAQPLALAQALDVNEEDNLLDGIDPVAESARMLADEGEVVQAAIVAGGPPVDLQQTISDQDGPQAIVVGHY